MDIFNVSSCNVTQMIGEANRFLFHVLLIHIATCLIEGRTDFLSETLFKTLIITAVAVLSYHLFVRKIVEPPLKKMKMICRKQLNIPKKKKPIKKHKISNESNNPDQPMSENDIEEIFNKEVNEDTEETDE
jgi:hypothetical protein